MSLTLTRRAGLAALLIALLVAPAADAAKTKRTPRAFAQAEVRYYARQLPPGIEPECMAPAGNPAPGTSDWQRRDTENQYCASLRLRDQVQSPAFTFANTSQSNGLYLAQAQEQIADGPGHIHGGFTTLIPGAQTADPFRTLDRWTAAGLGKVTRVKFTSLDGAQLRGHVFEPNGPPPAGGYPGVVITDGSIQAYEQLYYWAAQDLVANGYEVMTFDVQGQGDSDLFPAGCPSVLDPIGATSCKGVPYQQNYNFYQGAEDALNWFLSAGNPYRADLDPGRIGIAGHSLGAAAVSNVGQCDNRVKTIVAWDNLNKVTDCSGVIVPPAYQYTDGKVVHTSALALTNDYLFNPQPASSPPNPHAKDGAYKQLVGAGLDSEIVTFRGATHLTYSYVPYVLPASELAERMAAHYTVAWFDRYLKGDPSGYRRLTTTTFDDSADRSSIGAGTYSVDKAQANPTDPMAGNVPYKIAGIPVANAVSFYYESAYSLRDPATGLVTTCVDMRAACPAVEPPTP
jgi:dienelactone hydrolase